MRILIRSLAALVVCLALGFYFVIVAPRKAHQRVVDRILVVIHRNDQTPPPGVDARYWENYLGCPHQAMGNLFSAPQYFPTDKLEAMAIQIETKWPHGLGTVDDVEGILEVMKTANPSRADYAAYEMFRTFKFDEEVSAQLAKSKKPPGH